MKIFKRKEQKKKNNKGFSLVELIVVIAIMAVLAVVLAPQFTKYVDRSRQSNDATVVSGIVGAVQTGIADVTTYTIAPDTYTIEIADKDNGGTTVKKGSANLATAATGDPKNMTDAIVDACGDLDKLTKTATAWGTDNIEVTIVVNADNTMDVTYTPDKFAKYIEK